MADYTHTQRARWLWWIMVGFVSFELVIALIVGEVLAWIILGAVAALLLVLAWLFSSLTVQVNDDGVIWHFGPGLWHHKLAWSEIQSAEPTRTKWWYGWGIRLTPRGLLYNIAGFDAVAVSRTNGKTTMIGTDEPQALAAALTRSTP